MLECKVKSFIISHKALSPARASYRVVRDIQYSVGGAYMVDSGTLFVVNAILILKYSNLPVS